MPPKRRGRGGGRGPGRPKKQKKAASDSDMEASSSDEEKSFSKDRFLSVMRYDFDQLVASENFNHDDLIAKISPNDFNLHYYEKTGLETPLFFNCNPQELGMKVPDSSSFTVDNVLELVGGERVIEVVEVSGQTSVKMTLEEFVNYYNTPKEKRKTLYNVLSLEFSLDKLRDFISGPSLVKDVDWVENYWPDALYQRYISFNKKGFQVHQSFPKVQNYCLMSVERCYTDFHIDFGGTSVWYHVLKGQKIFWMIEPTDSNIRLYEEFIKNPEQTGFFGDVVDKCARVILNPGDTMIIPSGWIHAVYTPVDSLVFGGNFVHSLRASKQIKVFQSENRISITKKFRFPYLDQLTFYVIAKVVEDCTSRKYARPLSIKNAKLDYVGKLWLAQKGHHKMIKVEDFKTNIEEHNVQEDDSGPQEPGSINVIAMHAENIFYGSESGLEEEHDENSTTNDENRPTDMEIMSQGIFYHEQSVLYDLHGRSTCAHKNPIGEEPPMTFNDEELSKISERRLREYDQLCDYMRKKRLVDVAEGITRPASLLQAFQSVLDRRHAQFEEQGISVEPAPWVEKKKRLYRKTSTQEIDHAELVPTESSIPLKEEMKEEIHDGDNDIGKDSKIEESADKDDVKDMREKIVDPKKPSEQPLCTDIPIKKEDKSACEESFVDVIGEEKKDVHNTETKPSKIEREQGRKSKDKPKMERKSSRKTDLDHARSFEEALMTNVKPRRKSDSKKDKPLYAGGIPLAPLLEDEPVVPNPYNYDPKAEIMKLGTGQLKSAYRKSNRNIEPPKEKKMYKLEHKVQEEKRQEVSQQDSSVPGSSTPPHRPSFMPRVSEHPELTKKPSFESLNSPPPETTRKSSDKPWLHLYAPTTPQPVKLKKEDHWKPSSVEKEKVIDPRIENKPSDPRLADSKTSDRPVDPRKQAEMKPSIPTHIAITKLSEVVRQLETLNNEW